MDLKVFDVEHGACALLTCDDQTRFMIDAGHNASTGWKPGDYLISNNISRLNMLAVTNYDEDHVSGIENLLDKVDIQWLSRNTSVSSKTIRILKSEHGTGRGIERLCDAIDKTFTGDGNSPLPTFKGLDRKIFSCTYPEFDDENNLSQVNYLSCNGTGVLFTGDLERKGWENLAGNAGYREAMRSTNVLIAPHHGRISEPDRKFFREFYNEYFPNIYYVVISDKGYQYNTQETLPIFSSFTKGGPFRGETRHILTTRKDNRIGFSLEVDQWHPY